MPRCGGIELRWNASSRWPSRPHPATAEIEGSALAGARGMLTLLDGDMAGALDAFGRGIAVLDAVPQRGPAPYRGLWPLLLAAHDDPRAMAAIGHAGPLA